uniref:Nup214_FG domain-containing protein n=1 Tax=Caenorhabditis tropicalis TaxID=1561998 RepID=A0A1I7U456_9PELO
MRCKKDKTAEWMQYHELSYSSSKWPLPPQLFPSAQLLVDWNVVLVGNSKTSEITTVGKRDEWQTWVPVEGEGIYLPTTASGKDTVAVGVAVDRSMTAEVALNAEGTQKHRPSPLILCLTNDGILTVHHVISTFEAHKPCQIPSQNIAISGLQKRQFNESKPVQKTPEPPRTPTTPAAAPMALFQQTSAPKPLIPATTPLSAPKPAIPTTPTKRVIPEDPRTPEDTKEKELMAKKKLLVEKWIHLNREMISTKDSVMKMGFAIGRVKSTVLECAEVVKSSLGDSKEVMEELRSLILVMERMSERTQHTVKDMDFEIYEKMELVSKVEEGETVVDALRSSSETEKLMRFNKLEASADALAAKFEDVTDQMKKLKAGILEKETMRKQAVLSPFRQKHGPETDVALKVMRNVSKIIVDTRDRIQRTELDFVRFQREKTVPKGSQKKKGIQKPMEISVLEGDAPRNAKLTDAEILKARQALVARIQKRGLVKTREIQTESYRTPREPKKREEIDTTSLSNAILKLSMTPRRVIPASSFLTPDHLKPTKSDATTQADEPPVIQKVLVEKQNVEERIVETTPKTMPEQKPPASSIFPGSLFGAKTQSPGSGSIFGGKSSIFGGQVTPKKKEVEAKREEPKEQLLQNPKDPIPKAEPPKVVEEAKVDPPKVDVVPKETPKPEIPKPEEKELIPKVEEPPKPSEPLAQVVEEQKTPIKVDMEKEPEEPKKETPKASFSFNTTPKTTSSIFGGGLQTTPGTGGSSSIFGSKAPVTTTPSSSIFGGGLKTTTASPFGSFGQTAAPPTTSQPVSFSFNTGAPATQSKGFFGGSTAPSKPSSVFGGAVAAPSVPSVDDGMEDDSVSGGGPGGFMSGLGGSAPSTTTASSNLFAPKQPTTTTTSNSWLFGGGAQQNQASKPSFSFATPSSSTASPPSAASTNSVFGAAPKFGSQPVFGAKPFGGGAPGLSKNASIFGGGATTGGSGGGFAQFAGGQKTSVFGGGAQQPATNASIFGGGAQTPAAPASSIFGGGSSANANKPSSFSSWR